MKVYTDCLVHEYVKAEDFPKAGELFVAIDPQLRCGKETFVVGIMGDGTLEGDTTQYGLFWKREMAVLFAEALEGLKRKERG